MEVVEEPLVEEVATVVVEVVDLAVEVVEAWMKVLPLKLLN